MNRFLVDVLQVTDKAISEAYTWKPGTLDSYATLAPKLTDENLPTKCFDLLESALNISATKQVTPMWLQFAARMFSSLPYIVAGIQHMHGDTIAGSEKKQLALDALGLSYQVASTVDPQHAPAIQAATVMAGNAINDLVTLMHAAGESPKALPPAPVTK